MSEVPPQLGESWSSQNAPHAYQSNKIRTSPISVKRDCALRIAFRNDTNETLSLCWVSSDRKPFHFYALKPSLALEEEKESSSHEEKEERAGEREEESCRNKDDDSKDQNKKNVTSAKSNSKTIVDSALDQNSTVKDEIVDDNPSSTASNTTNNSNKPSKMIATKEREEDVTTPILVLTDRDHVEKTFLGHAFVLARCHGEKKAHNNDDSKNTSQNKNAVVPDSQPNKRRINSADVIGGYRPTSLTLGKNDDGVNERLFHLVTVTKRRRRLRQSDSSDSLARIEIEDDDSINSSDTEMKLASIGNDFAMKKGGSSDNDDDDFDYILTVKERYLAPALISNTKYSEEDLKFIGTFLWEYACAYWCSLRT